MRRLAVITAILASTVLIAAPVALADGDPASDVLVQNTLFNPIGSGTSLSAQTRLEALLKASARAGFPIRVALIAAADDLGTATALWRDPRDYARYLWIELSRLYTGQVLVVMPDGFGLYGTRSGAHRVTSGELSVRASAPGPGEQLAKAALSAVPLLAHAAGHPIPPASLAAADRSVAFASGATAGGELPASAVIALVLGALLITAAWVGSLRARPIAPRR